MNTEIGGTRLGELPMGSGAQFEGIIDLITMKAAYFDGEKGETVRFEEIPANLKAEADKARHEMLDALSMFSDEIMEKALEDLREATIQEQARIQAGLKAILDFFAANITDDQLRELEKIQTEFAGVKRTYLPLHSVVRIDEVKKSGVAKVSDGAAGSNVSPFPFPVYTPPGGPCTREK